MHQLNKIKLATACALLCVLGGCIEFEAQTLSYRHDSKSDTLYIFQNYHGIFGVNSVGVRLESEEALQLKSVMTGGRTFLFNNWIFEYNREALQETIAKPVGEIDEVQSYEAAIRSLCELALENIKVENVGFYKDSNGRLCGAQRVTIRNVSKLVPALNAMLLEHLASQAGDSTEKETEEVKTIRHYLSKRESPVTLDGNRIMIRVPLPRTDFEKYLQSTQGKALQESAAIMEHSDGLLTIQLGSRAAERVSITLPFSEKRYSGNALSEATKYGMMNSFEPHKAAASFLSVK